MDKVRLDNLLVESGLADSRSKAQALILAGKIYMGEQKLDKPGQMLASNTLVTVREAEHPYVSRGGMKLAHALEAFGLSVKGMVCMDIGASTGGFTDVLLRAGANKIYAIDVGHGQLDWKLRNDRRVVVMEKTNARHLDAAAIQDPVDCIVCDASFISLKTILPAPMALATHNAILLALIKPQFEVGKGRVGKGGVVRDTAMHQAVCEDITQWLDGQMHWRVLGVVESPVKGPKGNTEFLVYARNSNA